MAIASWSIEGFMLLQSGRLAEAEEIYRKILAAQPDHFDSLHLLGFISCGRGEYARALDQIDFALENDPDHSVALNSRGLALQGLKRFEEALASYDHALAGQPDYAEAHSNRGQTLHELKRFEEALASYDRALALWPDFAEAHYNRGNALHELERFEEALASFERALALRPDMAGAHYMRGTALYELTRFAEALASYDRALALWPDFADVHYNRGIALHELERFEEALASLDRALALRPDMAGAHYMRGTALHQLRRFEEALASYDRALALQPDFADAHLNRGNPLYYLRRFEEALASYDRALALQPDLAAAHSNRGNALYKLGRFEEALANYERALTLRPGDAVVICNRGVTLHHLKRFKEALASYEAALAARPDYADAHYNEAHCRMLLGDFPRGWEKHESRWDNALFRHGRRNFAQPQWSGSDDVAGKTILLHADHGYGDTIQFCRYAPLVAARGARVILEVQEPLRELMRTLDGAAQVLAKGEPLPDFDLHCPLLSQPLAFGTQVATIPSATPYLRASPAAARRWDTRLGARHRPRIGFAWSGSPLHENDHNRSIGLGSFLQLFAGVDATFVGLQRDIRAGDAALLQGRSDVLHFGEEFKDFSDTAAVISNLDLIVSVDTSVVHLAGALAKPVWVLLPFVSEWRWLLDREDSPWYPTARLFRQDETRAWDSVIARVRAALHDYVRSL
jgi:tetratricopeptide (TPR) repeat protein